MTKQDDLVDPVRWLLHEIACGRCDLHPNDVDAARSAYSKLEEERDYWRCRTMQVHKRMRARLDTIRYVLDGGMDVEED